MAEQKIFDILQEFLKRLKKSRYTFAEPSGQRTRFRPFFCSLSLVDSTEYSLELSNGGIMSVGKNPSRFLHGRTEVRMGHYLRGGGVGSSTFILPQNFDKDASSHDILEKLNNAFWQCVEDYGQRNLNAMGSRNKREKYLYFSKENPERHIQDTYNFNLDMAELTERFREASRRLAKGPLWYANIDFDVQNNGRYLLTSEGTRIFSSFRRCSTVIEMIALDSKNRFIPHSTVFYSLDAAGIPSLDVLLEKGEQLKTELSEILKAPQEKNGSYPVLMCPKNHGVLWHEVIGHALEGHRMQDDDEDDIFEEGPVTIFRGKIGKRIGPEFISVTDDPTYPGLDGTYDYDAEGVRSQKVELVRNGILKSYLHSRASAGFFRTHSNGHARASSNNDPVARMSNLIVKSSNEAPLEQLKENLIKECERQHEPYGLIFFDSAHGLTLPSECHFETYPSQIMRVYRNGKEERARGIYVLGTPYQLMKNVIQTSDRYEPFRGTCGAESGYIPDTTIAPHVLLSSVEVNRIPNSSYDEIKKIVVPRPKRK